MRLYQVLIFASIAIVAKIDALCEPSDMKKCLEEILNDPPPVLPPQQQDCHGLIQYPRKPKIYFDQHYRELKPGAPMCSSSEIYIKNFYDCYGDSDQFEPVTEVFSYMSVKSSNICNLKEVYATTIVYNSKTIPFSIYIEDSIFTDPKAFSFLKNVVFNTQKSKDDFCSLKKKGELKLFRFYGTVSAPNLTPELEQRLIDTVDCDSAELETLEKLKQKDPVTTANLQTQCCYGFIQYAKGSGTDQETRNQRLYHDFIGCPADAPLCTTASVGVHGFDDCSCQIAHQHKPVAPFFGWTTIKNSNVCHLQEINEVTTLYYNPNNPIGMITIWNSNISNPKAFAKLDKIEFHTKEAKDKFCKLKKKTEKKGKEFRIFDVQNSTVPNLGSEVEKRLIDAVHCPVKAAPTTGTTTLAGQEATTTFHGASSGSGTRSRTTPGSKSGTTSTPGSDSGSKTTPGPKSGTTSTPGSGTGFKTTPGPKSGTTSTPGSGTGSKTTPGPKSGTTSTPRSDSGSKTTPGSKSGTTSTPGSGTRSKTTPGPKSGTTSTPRSDSGSKTTPGPKSGTTSTPGSGTRIKTTSSSGAHNSSPSFRTTHAPTDHKTTVVGGSTTRRNGIYRTPKTPDDDIIIVKKAHQKKARRGFFV